MYNCLDIENIVEFIEQMKVIKTGFIGIDFEETYYTEGKMEVELLVKSANKIPNINWEVKEILEQHKKWKSRLYRSYSCGYFTQQYNMNKPMMPKAWKLSHEIIRQFYTKPRLYCGIEKYLGLHEACYAKMGTETPSEGVGKKNETKVICKR